MNPVVLFDLDGTLIDSTDAILDAFKEAYKQIGVDYPGDKFMINHFGMSLDEIISLQNFTSKDQDRFRDVFTQTELVSDKHKLISGIGQVISVATQNNRKLVIVTSKRRRTAEHVLDVVGIADNVDILITADLVKKTKPDPEPLLLACKKLGIDPLETEVYYIGDSLPDVRAAKLAHITPLAVTWGAHQERLTEEFPDLQVFRSPDQLYLFLKDLVEVT